MSTKLPIAFAVLILVASAAIRVHFAVRCDVAPDYSDMEMYNEAALKPGFPMSLPPGYPLFLKATYAVFGSRNYRAVFVAQALISAMSVFLIYWVTRRIGGWRAGLTAAAVAAVYPDLIVYNLTTLSDTFGVLFVMILYAVLVSSINDRKKSLWAAIILGISFTFRPVFLFFAPGVLLSLKKRLAFVVAAAVVLAPLISYELIVGESFQRGARTFYKSYNPKSDGRHFGDTKSAELAANEAPGGAYIKAAWMNIRNNKVRVLESMFNKTKIFLSAGWDEFVMRPIVGTGRGVAFVMKYAYIPVLLFGFIGMSRLYSSENRMIALPALSYLVFVLLFSIFKYRYRLVVVPVLIMYASMFFWRARIPPPPRDGQLLS
jgi:hypothetical protein